VSVAALPRGAAAVVTGASSGIGLACAERLAAEGLRVFGGVRDEAGAARVREAAGGRVTPLRIDVADATSLAGAASAVSAAIGSAGLFALVASAGTAAWGPLELLAPEALRRELEVNVVGQVATLQAFLPLLRRARGRIVLVGSISGRAALPYTGAYAAGKHALEAIADALRLELRPFGVAVTIVEPGRIDTPLWRRVAGAVERARRELAPEDAARYGAVYDAAARAAARGGGLPAAAVAAEIAAILAQPAPPARRAIGRDARRALLVSCLPARLRDLWVSRRMPGASRGSVRG
jgi:NAD(P)-dependent dehydrogenase (short-subunit alcohol dehydrogenase family)